MESAVDAKSRGWCPKREPATEPESVPLLAEGWRWHTREARMVFHQTLLSRVFPSGPTRDDWGVDAPFSR